MKRSKTQSTSHRHTEASMPSPRWKIHPQHHLCHTSAWRKLGFKTARKRQTKLYYMINNFSSLSCILSNLWVLTVKFSLSFATSSKSLRLPCLPSFSNLSAFWFKYLHFDGQLDPTFVTPCIPSPTPTPHRLSFLMFGTKGHFS